MLLFTISFGAFRPVTAAPLRSFSNFSNQTRSPFRFQQQQQRRSYSSHSHSQQQSSHSSSHSHNYATGSLLIAAAGCVYYVSKHESGLIQLAECQAAPALHATLVSVPVINTHDSNSLSKVSSAGGAGGVAGAQGLSVEVAGEDVYLVPWYIRIVSYMVDSAISQVVGAVLTSMIASNPASAVIMVLTQGTIDFVSQ